MHHFVESSIMGSIHKTKNQYFCCSLYATFFTLIPAPLTTFGFWVNPILSLFLKMDQTGIEPATSSMPWKRSSQLSYWP